MAQFYRVKGATGDTLYDAATNKKILNTQAFQSGGYGAAKANDLGYRTIPQGASAIPSTYANDPAGVKANFTNITPIGNTLYGKPISTGQMSGTSNAALDEAKKQNAALQAQLDTLNNIPQGQTQEDFNNSFNDFKARFESYNNSPEIQKGITERTTAATNLADIQKTSKNYNLETQQQISKQDFNPNLLTSQVGKSQAQINRERSFGAQENVLNEANAINLYNIANDNLKTYQEMARSGQADEAKLFELQQNAQKAIFDQKKYVYEQAQKLTDNAKTALSSVVSYMAGTNPDTLTALQTSELKNLADSAGLPFNLLIAGLGAKYQEAQIAQNQASFDQSFKLANLQLDRSKFSSDQAYREAQLALDALKIDQGAKEQVKVINNEAFKFNPSTGELVKLNTNAVGASPEQIQVANDTINFVDKLLNSPSLDAAVGPVGSKLPTFRSGTSTFEQNFATLQSLLALGNLNKLKGPMSDKDIQFLKDASSGLSLTMGESAFKQRLGEIRDRANVVNLKPGELQENTDGTYSYRNIDGTVHTGKLGDNYKDTTLPKDLDLSELSFNGVASDTYKAGSYLSNYGAVTGEGSPLWKWGLDVDLKKGDPVYSPVDGEVVFSGKAGGFGNRVGIKTPQGNIVYLSHNDYLGVKKGDPVVKGQKIALGGNTGNTIPVGSGDGSHLDITVKKPDGTYYPPEIIRKILA